MLIVAILILFAMTLAACIPAPSNNDAGVVPLTETTTAVNETQAPLPTSFDETMEPSPVPTEELNVPASTEFIDEAGLEMVLVPAGEFPMGSDVHEDEGPIHTVSLDAYYIDKYEVTNAAYDLCVDAGTCTIPWETYSATRDAYYGNPEFDDFPVVFVDWNMANTYCEWRGGRLPTEAEWEKAARGTDGRTFPWGEVIDCDKANYGSHCVGDTTKVGSYPDGVSPYGAYDMAGNVWEWVSDWYDGNYYQNSPSSNPLGPSSGNLRVHRGGSWWETGDVTRSSFRDGYEPSAAVDEVGFRCVRPVP